MAGMIVAAVAPEPMTMTFLPLVLEIVRPGLRVDDAALEGFHAVPLRGKGLVVVVVALAHPQEVGSETEFLIGVGADAFDGPEIIAAGPGGIGDFMAVADVWGEMIFLDDFAHVGEDFLGGGDGDAGPGLEAVAESMKVAVGTDAGVFMGDPGAAEGFL